MWSSAAWSAVIVAYVSVVALGIVCECFRVRRERAKSKSRAAACQSTDVIGFR